MYNMNYDCKFIGEKLKKIRIANNLTVKQVTNIIGLGSVQALYKIERGDGYPSLDTFLRLLDLYQVEDYKDITNKHDNIYDGDTHEIIYVEDDTILSRNCNQSIFFKAS